MKAKKFVDMTEALIVDLRKCDPEMCAYNVYKQTAITLLNFDIQSLAQLKGFLEVEVLRLSQVPAVQQLLMRVVALLQREKEFETAKQVEQLAVQAKMEAASLAVGDELGNAMTLVDSINDNGMAKMMDDYGKVCRDFGIPTFGERPRPRAVITALKKAVVEERMSLSSDLFRNRCWSTSFTTQNEFRRSEVWDQGMA